MRGTDPESYLGGQLIPPTYQAQRHILSFLKWRFSSLPAGCYRYVDPTDDPDSKETEIFIGADTPIDPKIMGQRPAITVSRGPASFQGVGFNDMAELRIRDGTRTKIDMIPSTLYVNVLSTLPIEAERIAFFTAEQIWAYSDEIVAKEPCIHQFGSRPSFSPPSPAGSLVNSTDFEWCVVSITYPIFLTHLTVVQPINRPYFGSDLRLKSPAQSSE